MIRRFLSCAACLALAALTPAARAQHPGGHAATSAPQGHTTHTDPLFYNNPTNQAGTSLNDPALQYNNPLNQVGMYLNDPVLRYNNPLNQAGMYLNDPVLQYNNPLNQAGMYLNDPVLRYNEPTNQVGMYNGGGFNNQSGVAYGAQIASTNSSAYSAGSAVASRLFGGYLNPSFGYGNASFGPGGAISGTTGGFFPGVYAVNGSYNSWPSNGFGWNSYGLGASALPMNFPVALPGGALMPAALYPTPTAPPTPPLVGSTRGNTEASAILNGAIAPTRNAERPTQKPTASRRKSGSRRK